MCNHGQMFFLIWFLLYFPRKQKVKCSCKENYGSDDCSVDLTQPPEFTLAETCCDTSTMNCEKIIGISPKISNTDELEIELKLYLDDGSLVNQFFFRFKWRLYLLLHFFNLKGQEFTNKEQCRISRCEPVWIRLSIWIFA